MPERAAVKAFLGTVPNPDPTERTIQALQREIEGSRERFSHDLMMMRELIEARLNGNDQAVTLLRTSTEKFPLMVNNSIERLQELHEEKFSSIATQFTERDKRTEQLTAEQSKAIAAALQAQKEAAGSTTEMIIAAITKMEGNFAKLIDQGQALLMEVKRNTDERINDLKSRLDRGEGKSSSSEPIITETLAKLTIAVQNLTLGEKKIEGQGIGQREVVAFLIAAGALTIAFFKR